MEILLFSAKSPTSGYSFTATPSSPQLLPDIGSVIRIASEGPSTCFVCVSPHDKPLLAILPGDSPSDRCTPVLAGEDITLRVDAIKQKISGVCRSGGTAVVSVSVGNGA
jgi:hypothetical protein